MKKEISLRISLKERVKFYVASCAEALAQALAQAMSVCLEEKVSPAQALRIFHALVAFTVLVFSYGHAFLSVLFLIWFVLTLVDCKRAGLSGRG